MTSNNISRRIFLTCLTALSIRPHQVFAFSVEEARDLVGKLVSEITTVINSGQSENQMIAEFENILVRYGDMQIIAQSVLGIEWRSASTSQKSAFTDAFQGYIARKYGKQFRDFIGGTIQVDRVRQVRSFYEVKSTAQVPGSAPFEVVFLVSDRSGEEKFFNMIVEGINLRTTENVEIGSLLDKNRGNLDAMIAELRQIG